MAKTVYHTRSFPVAQAQQHAIHPAAVRQHPVAAAQRTVAMPPARAVHSRSGLMLLVGCLVLALMAVLLVPLMVGGAVAPNSKLAVSSQVQVSTAIYSSVEQAAEAVGIKATVPAALPEGYSLAECRVLDGNVLELEYTGGKGSLLYRTAAGSDDLSGVNSADYAFTATETVDGISRGYAGVSEKKLNLAVWAYGGSSYAILASEGMDAQALRQLAESVK